MKQISFYCIALFALILASCGTTVNVTSDYDRANNFAGYKTFSVVDIKTKGQVSSLNAERIVNAIKSEMTKKGFTESSNPDLQVNAMTFLKDKQSVTANSNYYGYGGGYRSYGYWGGGGVGMATGSTTYSTYNYKDGSLIIDIVDAKTNKMVWTGTGNAEIDKAPKNPDEFIGGAVTKILAAFPPGK